ncbi:RnfABCDGE type electron transport complex subunit B [bacterium]|nr:RnfABCDGE type electron transport complex subunit B [bacterium]
MTLILISIVVLVSLGVLFGIALGVANKVFYVKEDPRIAKIEESLPGANCGACGYPGCAAYAEAVIKGEDIDKCTPGGKDAIAALGEVMGKKAGKQKTRKIAYLICQGDRELAPRRSEYTGVKSCAEVKLVGGGDKSCSYGCFGYGDCEDVCPFDAIHIMENGLPEVDEQKCTACGKCIVACPQNVLILQPVDKEVLIRCVNHEPAKDVMKECKVGCISCSMCFRACPIDGAITMEDNLAIMHYEECVDCGICAQVCPKNSITDKRSQERKIPVINEEKCNACTLCYRKCPVDAIIGGKPKEKHVIKEEQCIGCLKCYDVCRFDAIDLVKERPKTIEFYKDKKYNRTDGEHVKK